MTRFLRVAAIWEINKKIEINAIFPLYGKLSVTEAINRDTLFRADAK